MGIWCNVRKKGYNEKAPRAPQIFGNAGEEHMEKYGSTPTHFAKIAYKNHKHSVLNPYSQFRDEYTLDDILNSRKIFKYLTMLQCCPTSDGAACAVLCSENFVKKHHLEGLAVQIIGQSMATDDPNSNSGSLIDLIGASMVKKATAQAFQEAKKMDTTSPKTTFKLSNVMIAFLQMNF